MKRVHSSDEGFVLLTSLIVIVIMTGLILAFVEQVRTEQNIAGNDLDYTNAFYAAEAGLEKQNADLSKLFQQTIFPTTAQIDAIEALASQPVLPDITYTEYTVTGGQSTNLTAAINDSTTTIPTVSTAGWPTTGYFMIDSEEITYTGLTATSFTGAVRGANATAAAAHGNARIVSRSRVILIAEGPNEGLAAQVIPFDLTVTAQAGRGSEARLNRETQVALVPVFQFGVFTDSDLAFHAGPSFDFGGRVHTNGNLFLMQGGGAGNTLTMSQRVTAVREVIRMQRSNRRVNDSHLRTVSILTSPGNFRNLGLNEGSVVAGLGSAANAAWPGLSLTTYNGNILNGDTGAKPLTLPFAGGGAAPVEIIRRPPAGEDPTSILGQSRLYNQASVRILLSDSTANLPGGVGYPLNDSLEGNPWNYTVDATRPPFAETDASDSDFKDALGNDETSDNPAIDGFIKIDIRLLNGNWQDVTMEVLNLGISQTNPDAILKFQRLKTGAGNGSQTATDYWSLKLYDTREGELRQYISSGPNTKPSNMTKLGLMGIIELDVTNLRRWFEGTIGVNGVNALNNSGYIVYFSDRRGNRDNNGNETGEFGWEDYVNPNSQQGTPNGVLDEGEDVNENGTLETYGANLPVAPFTPSTDLWANRYNQNQAKKNKIHYFRRGLRLVNGGGANLPDPGFTVSAENAVYVQGNYNADNTGFGGTHSFAAVIADTVKLLSNAWSDDKSFSHPQSLAAAGRNATSTWFRVALAAGKTPMFTYPNNAISDSGFGGDGGVHNFFHYMERWSGDTLSYLGSLVSLYHSHQAIGLMKCCQITYSPPIRNFTFDVEFLVPSQLPPGIPRFRDINNLSFRQTIRSDF